MTLYPVIFSQRQSPWNVQRLGTVNGTTIGNEGCYVTCMAMKSQYYGHDVNPGQLDDLFTNQKIYVSGDLLPDNGLSRVFPDCQYLKTIDCASTPADLIQIQQALSDSTQTVTIEIDFDHNPNDGIQTHFVEVKDCDGQHLTIVDPWFGTIDDFSVHYGNDPKTTIIKIVIYKGNPKEGTMVNAGLPANYTDIIHGSSQWDSTVSAYLPTGTLPKDASFEDIQKVVAGYKSQATASQNQLNQCQIDLASVRQDAANKADKISTLTQQMTDNDTAWKVRYDALNKTAGSVQVVTAQYEGVVAGLKKQFSDEQDAHHEDLVTLAEVQTTLTQCQTAQNKPVDLTGFSVIQLITALLAKWRKR